jgi:thioredoxin-related protein
MQKIKLFLLVLTALLVSSQCLTAQQESAPIMGPRRPGIINPQTPANWVDDFEYAKTQALKKNQKMVLLFTGSDWCIWCKRMAKDFLNTPRFKEMAKSQFIPVYLDFPAKKTMPAKLKAQNEKLREEFTVPGYPTVVILSPKGERLADLSYDKNFLDDLDKLTK